jgi:hypothetical protein
MGCVICIQYIHVLIPYYFYLYFIFIFIFIFIYFLYFNFIIYMLKKPYEKVEGEREDSRRTVMSPTAALSPNESSWGGEGGCLGFLGCLDVTSTHGLTTYDSDPNVRTSEFNDPKTFRPRDIKSQKWTDCPSN